MESITSPGRPTTLGAIPTGRYWTFRGNRIRHNSIQHTGGIGCLRQTRDDTENAHAIRNSTEVRYFSPVRERGRIEPHRE